MGNENIIMESRLKIGELKTFVHTVTSEDLATFDAGTVHAVCSTFALAKYIEWTSRLFVINIKEEDEEGVGTKLSIEHISPGFKNQTLHFKATVIDIIKNELICSVVVSTDKRIIAKATTGQKLLKKERINKIFSSLANPK